jgi:NADH:ubiquinone oxidoreductase subunit E
MVNQPLFFIGSRDFIDEYTPLPDDEVGWALLMEATLKGYKLKVLEGAAARHFFKHRPKGHRTRQVISLEQRHQVLERHLRGQKSKYIAEKMGIKPRTVRSIITSEKSDIRVPATTLQTPLA